jgi:biofilm PGA synthesis protein PgaA
MADNSTDSVEEGHATRRRLGGGAQARWPDWKLVALAWSQDGSLNTGGGSLAAQWEPTDQWTLKADAARHSPDAPLRADLHGITADSVRGGVRHAWNESLGAGLLLQHMDFSDGNDRRQVTVDGVLKLLDRPHLDITLKPRVEWQSNSLTTTPYFSPKESWLGSVEAQVEHVVWRAYERTFVQRVSLTLGVFNQYLFGSHGVGGVSYEQCWRHDPWTELSWGLEWTNMVYDGSRERALRAYFKVEHRFGR